MEIIKDTPIDINEAVNNITMPQFFKCRSCGRHFVMSIDDVRRVRESSPKDNQNFLFIMARIIGCCSSPKLKWVTFRVTPAMLVRPEEGGDV